MTGSRRFSLSSPDWGQAHLTLDAIVAYVDDELSAGAHARAEAHLRCCGECRTEVVAQRQARAALRDAGGPCLPSNLLRSLRSIPVETELPPMPPGLGVTADGQFVLLRDAVPPCDHHRSGPVSHHSDPPPAGLASGPSTAPRRFSRRARYGAVSGIALSALTVGALVTPSDVPEPTPQNRVLGGAVLDLPARLSPPSSSVPTGPTLAAPGASVSQDPAVPAVLDARLRDRLNRIPAAFRPDQ